MLGRFSGTRRSLRVLLSITIIIIAALSVSCSKEQDDRSYSIAVFIPGVISGSPIYEKLAEGVASAAEAAETIDHTIIEGGTNQGTWEEELSELAAGGSYDLIITSNPAMPAICAAVAEKFPSQKFAVLDGYLQGNEQIYTLRYDQRQQALLSGHMAGLITTSDMDGANEELLIGLIAGQEYPDMNEQILPAFLEGARLVDQRISVEFRVVGNWYDAAKGAELTRGLIEQGVDVILPVAGGANQGVITAAADAGVYVLWTDSNGYAQQPGTVAGSTEIDQQHAASEIVQRAAASELPFGSADTVGIAEGYIRFIEDDQLYRDTVPQELRSLQHEFIESISAER